jgi:putative cell wall-binding protein
VFTAAPGAVLARADTFPDALAAGPLASQVGGPILLTPRDRLGEGILAELDRLGVATVYLAGGEAALGPEVARALTEAGYTVERFDGEGRVETAALIADRMVALGGPVASAIVVRADAFPDALAAVNLGSYARAPILLTPTAALDGMTEDALERLLPEGAPVSIAGGVEAVGPAVETRLDERYDVVRLAGPTRYHTAVALVDAARTSGADTADTFVASGTEFPDALSAGVAAHALGGVVQLVDPFNLDSSPAFEGWLAANRRGIERVTLVGGEQAVAPVVVSQIAQVLANSP